MTNFDLLKLKELSDDNNEYDENGGKFSKRIENTAGRGKTAHFEQFILFPQCFRATSTADVIGKWLTLSQTSPGFYVSAVKVL